MGVLAVGGDYRRSAVTGATTAASNVASKRSARRGLDLQARSLDQQERFQEEELDAQKKAARTKRNMSAAGMVGGAIGSAWGPVGFAVGSALGSMVGGLF